MRLLLVRHGQTPSNVLGLLDTAIPGPGLTELGVEQAEAVPEALAGERIDAIFASTLTRTALTAAPLAAERGLEVLVRDGIRELAAGDLEMRGDEPAVEAYLTVMVAWAEGDVDRRMPGGETGREALARFDGVVAEAAALVGDDGTAVLVSHGAAIRIWSGSRARNLDARFIGEHSLGNTGQVVLEGSPEGGWLALDWAGVPVGGGDVADGSDGGPAGEPVDAEDPADLPLHGS